MYLKHFGLNEPPFKITPVTSFFFSGGNRGEILDALIYAITGSEGIIKVTGEVGSGKTMLSRMLLERLPLHVEPVYLANPSLSREEMLYAIADSFNLNLEGQRVNIILQTIQNLLEQKLNEGKRVVILVDEAHAMPLDTLEELRLLYNLQVGDQKLLQIVLFGQPELNEKLDQPNMRQLKDRIVHHFTMQPLSKTAVESYLMFRMRTAGFRGSNIFSSDAVKLIDNASQGLLRRVNVIADKALLAAFVEDVSSIDARHVQEAIRDSDLAPRRSPRKLPVAAIATLAVVLLVLGALWAAGIISIGKPAVPENRIAAAPLPGAAPAAPTNALPLAEPVVTAAVAPAPAAPDAVREIPPGGGTVAAKPASERTPIPGPELPALLRQRLDATRALFGTVHPGSASIQLFYTEDAHPARIGRLETFLERAKRLGTLNQIYVVPSDSLNHGGYRILYGMYPSIGAANTAMLQLPPAYRESYAPTLYIPNAIRTAH